MRKKTCCFTGHRDLPSKLLPVIRRQTSEAIEKLISENHVRYFGVGGAIGYDTLAAEVLFELKKIYPHIKVILVYPFEGFTSRWSAEQKVAFAKRLPLYDKRVCVAKAASKESYLMRDRHLVDGSAYCIAYCTRETGGTAYTLRYAKEQGIHIRNIAEEIGGAYGI